MNYKHDDLCDDCNKRRGKKHYGFLCGHCYRFKATIISSPNEHSIEKALETKRIVKTYGKRIYGVIHVPRILIGKMVRVVLVENEK